MNKIYKIIWSKARNCYVVVSEIAKRNGKCSSSLNKKIIASFLAAGTVLSVTGSAWAEVPEGTASGTNAVAIGAGSSAKGNSSTVVGTGSAVNKNAAANYQYQGSDSAIFGAYNTIGAYSNTSYIYDGVANSIFGVANSTNRTNGALVLGAGNTVDYAYGNVASDEEFTAAASAYTANPTDANYKKMQEALVKAVVGNGGNVSVVGDGNTVQYANNSSITGSGNTLKGSSGLSASNVYAGGNNNTVQYATDSSIIGSGNTLKGYSSSASYASKNTYVTGDNNTATYTKNTTVIGSGNTVGRSSTSSSKNTIVIGDNNKIGESGATSDNIVIGNNRTIAKNKQNIIIGSAAAEQETTVDNGVSLGYGASVTVADGVAIGSSSVADVAKNKYGYDFAKKAASTNSTPAWRSTLGAVSVGSSKVMRRDWSESEEKPSGSGWTFDENEKNGIKTFRLLPRRPARLPIWQPVRKIRTLSMWRS